MYPHLIRIMNRKRMSAFDLAKELDITYLEMMKKLAGAESFTLDEAYKIKKLLKTSYPIKKLFSEGDS